jgi:signal transduction histidine kinase
MHPLLANRARLGAYLLGWAPLVALMAVLGASQGWSWLEATSLSLALGLFGAFLFLTAWYLCRALPLDPRGGLRTHAPAWLIAAMVMGGLWTGFARFLAWALGLLPGLHQLPGRIGPATPVLAVMGMLLYLAVLTLHYLLAAVERSRESERVEQELRVLARDAELKALRAQLNPHFLFNSLNSISALTTQDPARAREMCVLLSDFLRKSLRLGERPSVRLSEELDLLRNYLAIEQIRFGARLAVAWEVTPEAEQAEVPTLLLQPLVENAIKHGIAQLPEGGTIRLRAALAEGRVELRVENPVDPDAPEPQGLGMGLRQVKQRLQGRFGAQAWVEAGIRDGHHRVDLRFPAELP